MAKYASVFFKRWRELKDCEKIMRRIEQGEQKIQATQLPQPPLHASIPGPSEIEGVSQAPSPCLSHGGSSHTRSIKSAHATS